MFRTRKNRCAGRLSFSDADRDGSIKDCPLSGCGRPCAQIGIRAVGRRADEERESARLRTCVPLAARTPSAAKSERVAEAT